MIKTETELFRELQNECFEIFKKKNADYDRVYRKYGLTGMLMRLEDKISRFRTISKNKIELVQDEKMRDTLQDLSNYALMAIILLDENEENK